MVKLSFKDLSFQEKKNRIVVSLLENFYFEIEENELRKIGDYQVDKNSVVFSNISKNKAEKKFNFLISQNIKNLKSRITKRNAIYIHSNSGIPLIGTNYFGIVDRGTSLIEIKPINGCNLNCIFCSIDEGPFSKTRIVDFVVEKDYLVKELKKVIELKESKDIEVHIGTQGEPFLYKPIIELISDIKKIKKVKVISIDTNGTLLTKSLVDKLVKAGLTRFNLSINAIAEKTAAKLAGCANDNNHVLQIAKYIAKKSDLIITPILVQGINEQEMPKLIRFAKEIKAGKNCPPIGIQNFLSYKRGRNPAKQLIFDDFYSKLKKWGKEFQIKLITDLEKDFKIIKTNSLPKPFKKRNIIEAKIICNGRLRNEKLAVAKDRVISIPDCHKKGKVRIRILRSKHNIFVAKLL